jgi:hypothetical protein
VIYPRCGTSFQSCASYYIILKGDPLFMEVKHKGKNTYPERTKGKVRSSYDSLTSNDFAYYNKFPEDLENAARVEWAEFMGVPFQYSKLATQNMLKDGALPGILATDVIVGPGSCGVATDSVNRAFSRMMSDLYARTSASELKFDQASLAMFYTSVASIADLIATAKRAIRSAGFWINRNINYPRAIVEAMGFDYDDLIRRKSEYVIRLNEEISKYNTFGVLKSFDVFGRQYSMFKNIYIDEDSDLAQIYIFKQVNYYLYEDVNSKASYVQTPWTNYAISQSDHQLTTIGELINMIDTAIERWRGSQDFYYITGTIARAYPSAETMVIDSIQLEDVIDPLTDDVMMMQLMNATYVRGTYVGEYAEGDQPGFLHRMSITGDPVSGVISWGVETPYNTLAPEYTNYILGSGRMLRLFSDTASTEDITEMTRLTAFADNYLDSQGLSWVRYPQSSPEIVCSSLIFTFDLSTNTALNYPQVPTAIEKIGWITTNVLLTIANSGPDGNPYPNVIGYGENIMKRSADINEPVLVNNFNALFHIQPFRYIPLILLIPVVCEPGHAFQIGAHIVIDFTFASTHGAIPLGDVYNYTMIRDTQFSLLQRVCLRSLYEPAFLPKS